ncbi:peptidase family M49-domain-containing protein [Geopyxis carbonaria]|nr:peptidase family M49-domain-containing protein [Geopyxis carbonaria]
MTCVVYADSPPTICKLEIEPHFTPLTPAQKVYAHWISRASLLGTRITLRQVSPESEGIYDLIIALYKAVDGDWAKLGKETGVSEEDVKYWLEYAAAVLGNLGNYKSFGDQKFIPRISRSSLEKLASHCQNKDILPKKLADAIYAVEPAGITLLGYPEDGHISTYYPDSPDITKAEIEEVQELLLKEDIKSENTRLRKANSTTFELLMASAETSAPEGKKTEYDLSGDKKLKLVYGDYSAELKKIAEACKAASKAALNDLEAKMFGEYEKSFRTGSLEAHIESQKYWVQDKGPIVECNVGFIETYRDPRGVRGEWEGFVAMVNQEQTKKFGELVARASEFIPRLPWSSEFEKKEFLKPDFTSLEVLSFAGSGIPAGINIPNYDDLRQDFGFKNVSLGNVLAAKAPSEKTTFLREEDIALYDRLRGSAFEVQVGIHELLGHGTGKLLQETEKGKFNFDNNNPPINPITNEPVKTWYGPGETWGSVFSTIAASYEECRAECVAMYLGVEKDILGIFGFTEESETKADDIMFIEYLQMARAGLLALEYWDPKYKKWGQGHMQARFSILKTMLSAGPSFISLTSTEPDHSDLVINLNRDQIRSHGVPAIGEYLKKLHIYKSTADVAGGKKLYDDMTSVGEDMAKFREVVMRKKLPRKQFVMANTVLKGDEVELKEYEATPEGLIRSYVERDV